MGAGPIRFGGYLLVDRLTGAGRSEVWRGLRVGPDGDRAVVVKRRPAQGLRAARGRVPKPSHVNLVRVLEAGGAEGFVYQVAELVEGASLERLIHAAREGGGRLPPAAAAYILAAAARGVSHLHAGPDGGPMLLHLQLSPRKLLVGYGGEVKVAGFPALDGAPGTRAGDARRSPEQIAGEPLDGRADVFALGAMLFEALTGTLLSTEGAEGAAAQLEAGRFPSPSSRAPGIPELLDRVVLRAVARDREARWPSAAALHAALTRFLDEEQVTFGRDSLSALVTRLVPPPFHAEEPRDGDDEAEASAQPWPALMGRPAASRTLDRPGGAHREVPTPGARAGSSGARRTAGAVALGGALMAALALAVVLGSTGPGLAERSPIAVAAPGATLPPTALHADGTPPGLGQPAADRPATGSPAHPPAVVPVRTPVEDQGIRYEVLGAEPAGSSRLTLLLRVTNPTGRALPLDLRRLRLAGAREGGPAARGDGRPTVSPDAPTLPADSYRVVRLTFDRVDERLAEGAVLIVRPGLELAVATRDPPSEEER